MSTSLKLRLAVLVAVLGLLQALGVLAFAYLALDTELGAKQRVLLSDKALQGRRLVEELADGAAVRANAYRLVELVRGQTELHMAVASASSGELYAAFSREAARSYERLRQDTWSTDSFLRWTFEGRPMLSLASSGRTLDAQPYELVLTVDRSEDDALLHSILVTAGTAAPFGLAVVLVSAMAVVGLGLRPLHRFAVAASHVSATNLGPRLETSGLPAELFELARAFNLMLERLDDGVTRLSRFSGDLAHELRTPLATLLGRTQVAFTQQRSRDELLDVLEYNLEELRRLARLVEDMLFLAQADCEAAALQVQEVDLVAEARHVAAFLELAAEERDVAIAVTGAGQTCADRGLVRRAITNLLSNAIRHADAGTTIEVTVHAGEGGTVVHVANSGTPIPPEHLPRLFDRFYRADDARARVAGGTGLGLSIVQAIMHLHGGSVEAAAESGCNRFSLKFPSASGVCASVPGAHGRAYGSGT